MTGRARDACANLSLACSHYHSTRRAPSIGPGMTHWPRPYPRHYPTSGQGISSSGQGISSSYRCYLRIGNHRRGQMRGFGAILFSPFESSIIAFGTRWGQRILHSWDYGDRYARAAYRWRSESSPSFCSVGASWWGLFASIWYQTPRPSVHSARGQRRTANICSSHALSPRLSGDGPASSVLSSHLGRLFGVWLETDHIGEQWSGNSSLPSFGPFGVIETKSYLGVVPPQSMPFSTTQEDWIYHGLDEAYAHRLLYHCNLTLQIIIFSMTTEGPTDKGASLPLFKKKKTLNSRHLQPSNTSAPGFLLWLKYWIPGTTGERFVCFQDLILTKVLQNMPESTPWNNLLIMEDVLDGRPNQCARSSTVFLFESLNHHNVLYPENLVEYHRTQE